MSVLIILFLTIAWDTGNCSEFLMAKTANNYGPYTILWKSYEQCQGPKSKNLTTITVEAFNNETSCLLVTNTTFHTPGRISEIRIHVYRVNGAQKTILWNQKVDKPCQHYAIASLLAKYTPLQNNCVVKTGQQYIVVDFMAVAQQFFGTSFFYGVFCYKVVILANQGNVMCATLTMEFKKKLVT